MNQVLELEAEFGSRFVACKFDITPAASIYGPLNGESFKRIIVNYKSAINQKEELERYRFVPFGYRGLSFDEKTGVQIRPSTKSLQLALLGLFGKDNEPMELAYLPVFEIDPKKNKEWNLICSTIGGCREFRFTYELVEGMGTKIYERPADTSHHSLFQPNKKDQAFDNIRLKYLGYSTCSPWGENKAAWHVFPLIASYDPQLSFRQYNQCSAFFAVVLEACYRLHINSFAPGGVDTLRDESPQSDFHTLSDAPIRDWCLRYCNLLLTSQDLYARNLAVRFLKKADSYGH